MCWLYGAGRQAEGRDSGGAPKALQQGQRDSGVAQVSHRQTPEGLAQALRNGLQEGALRLARHRIATAPPRANDLLDLPVVLVWLLSS